MLRLEKSDLMPVVYGGPDVQCWPSHGASIFHYCGWRYGSLQSAINDFGSTVVASYTAASKVENLSTQIMITLGGSHGDVLRTKYGGRTV